MELLNRYLNAVRANLPKAQADDIVAEIADELQSQIDERESVVGHLLTTDEAADVLEGYGDPRVVAARYARYQFLIGPSLLPFYGYTIKVVLSVAIAFELAAGAIGALALHNYDIFYRSLDAAWHSCFFIIGIVTAAFALIERSPAMRLLLDRLGITKWDPRKLPDSSSKTVPYTMSIFLFLANALLALVLLDFGGSRSDLLAMMGLPPSAAWMIRLSPTLQIGFTAAWHPLYVALVISSLVLAFTGIVALLRADWFKLREGMKVIANALVAIGAALTLRGGQLFVPDSPTLEHIAFWSLVACIAVTTLTAARYLPLLFRKNSISAMPGIKIRHLMIATLITLTACGFATLTTARAAAPTDPVSTIVEASRKAIGFRAGAHLRVLEIDGRGTFGGISGISTSWAQIGAVRFAESYTNPPIVGGDGFDGTSAWNRDGSGLVWVDGGTRGRALEIAKAYLNGYALWGPGHSGASVTWSGSQTLGGKNYDVLAITPRGSDAPFDLWFDHATHLPARVVQKVGSMTSTVTFSDYRPFRGLMVARNIHTESNDGNGSDLNVVRIVADPPNSSALLSKPVSDVHDFSIDGGQSKTTVPMDLVENHVYLHVMLNGKGPFVFGFDTGGQNLIDPAVAAEIGAAPSGAMQASGVGSQRESVSFANIASLRIGKALISNQLFAVVPTRAGFGVSTGMALDGVIGFEVLARFVTTFDYARRQIVFTMSSAAAPLANALVVPFVFDERMPQFPCTIDTLAAQCSLDTGAGDSITLSSPFVAAHPQIVPSQVTAVGVDGFGLGGPSMGRLGRLRSLGIGSFTLHDLVADFSAQDSGAFAEPFQAANVGGGVWKRFSLTLNYAKQTMSLIPNAHANVADSYERSGLFVLDKGGMLVVLDARAGTPAAAAGLVRGDTIVAVNETPATAVGLELLRKIFAAPAGTTIHLEVVGKDGARRTVTLVLNDYV
jgi:hypothetical protein